MNVLPKCPSRDPVLLILMLIMCCQWELSTDKFINGPCKLVWKKMLQQVVTEACGVCLEFILVYLYCNESLDKKLNVQRIYDNSHSVLNWFVSMWFTVLYLKCDCTKLSEWSSVWQKCCSSKSFEKFFSSVVCFFSRHLL